MLLQDKKEEINRNSILYITKKLNRLDGRLKLMKLMFFVDYYDTKENKLTLQKTIGNRFIIYRRGPFSFSVYNTFLKLAEGGLITENTSIETDVELQEVQNKLPQEVRRKLNDTLDEFGKFDGVELEKKSLELLKIKPEEKSNYFGLPVDVIISKF